MATLTIKGKRPGPSREDVLDRLADLFLVLQEQARELARLEDKLIRQERWLDANIKTHPEAGKRHAIYWGTLRKRDRVQANIDQIAKQWERLISQLDAEGKDEAKRCVHDWATLGSACVYAVLQSIAPVRQLFPNADDTEAWATQLGFTVREGLERLGYHGQPQRREVRDDNAH